MTTFCLNEYALYGLKNIEDGSLLKMYGRRNLGWTHRGAILFPVFHYMMQVARKDPRVANTKDFPNFLLTLLIACSMRTMTRVRLTK